MFRFMIFLMAFWCCSPPVLPAANAGGDHAGHSHGSGLIPLGDEEYHARAVLDEEHQVLTITLLDKGGKKPVAVPAKTVLVNLRVDNTARQFSLKPVSLAADPEGLSSRFLLKSPELIELLHRPDTGAHFRVTIGTKSYAGKLNFSGHKH